jgi:hypothetical protein
MKKQLLSTSALVAAGMIAATGSAGTAQAQQVVQAPASSPIQITVGGFMRQFVGFFDSNDIIAVGSTVTTKVSNFKVSSDTEIYFQGKTTLANGISIAVRVELEGNTSNDMIDESFASIEGAFGRLELGSTDGAQAKTLITAPSASIFSSGTWPGVFGGSTLRTSGGTSVQAAAGFAINLGDEDSEKISYYTPRFEGFQLGLTYTPRASQDTSGGGSVVLNSDRTYVQGRSVGLNFTRAFGEVDVAASAGWMKWSKPDTTASLNTTTLSDPQMWAFGLQLGYAGFRVGGSYVRQKDLDTGLITGQAGLNPTLGSANNLVSHGNLWDLGLTYTFGPAVVGIQHLFSTSKDSLFTGLGDGTYESTAVTGKYTLGPGVDLNAAIFQYKMKGEQTILNAAGKDADDAKSTGLLIGLALTF